MRTDDNDFQNRLFSNPIGNKWLFKTGRREDWDNGKPVNNKRAEPYKDSRMRICCREKHCNSNIKIGRVQLMSGTKISIFVMIQRNLGTMVDPLDPAWLARIELEVRE
jgi:hypothetical protein